ncbi:uncharacterized protein LY79DRAFT_659277 [Colletotrichum navitas]|uniref:Protein kinase domain-containing protein n=1 Tax=Colletotrichum navitas TaxID=681940 RepID=A0AAD8PZX6_9PEZI|nr:uncharacterized protein LY79DRAFT_659277 [Colletotrichum navitas]KAK1590664.1 hypothetical protein LY79DRAFT_659277 [Colletotrichum navitas]
MPMDENQAPATAPHSEAEPGKMSRTQTPSSSSSTDIRVVKYDGISTPVGYPKNVSVAPSSSFNHASIIPKHTGDVAATAPSSKKDPLPPSIARIPLSTIPPPNHSNTRRVYKDGPALDAAPYNGHTITSKKGINKEKADLPLLNRESRRYTPGQMLTLLPLVPAPPHGLPHLPSLEKKLPKGQVRNFDSTTTFSLRDVARVEVLELIKGGVGRGIQLVLCKVVKAPTNTQSGGVRNSYKSFDKEMKVVLKVFDPVLFPQAEDWDVRHGKMSEDDWADELLSREANALQHLYNKGITGHPHPAPQYHGTWAMEFEFKDLHDVRKRHVGAVLMEYIEGASMESMCDRKIVYDDDGDDDDWRVLMVPNNAFLSPPSSQDGKSGVSFSDLSARLKVFRTLLDGCVSFLHAGIDRNTFLARDIFLTLGNNGVDLEEPRVVFLDYSYSVVWSDTTTSKQGRADEYDGMFPKVPSHYLLNEHPLQQLPRPPHPAWKYNARNLSQFAGWFPPEWMDRPGDLKDWLEKEFGELVEGKYSTYKTLVRVLEQASEAAKRRYFAEYPGKAAADLETGDRTLMLHPEREEKRLREEAKHKEETEEFRETMRRIKQFEEEEKSRVDQPKDVDKKSGTWGKFRLPFRSGKDKGVKQAKDGGHGGDAEGGASASVGGGPAGTSTKRQGGQIDDDGKHGAGEGGGESLIIDKKRRKGKKPEEGEHGGDEGGGAFAKPKRLVSDFLRLGGESKEPSRATPPEQQ